MRQCQTDLHAVSQMSDSDLECRSLCAGNAIASLLTTQVNVIAITISSKLRLHPQLSDVIMTRV